MGNNLIGISGKIGSGKDEVFKIIQKLTNNSFENRKFADRIKDMVCLLLNCTREQLEDREFKEKELGEEWKVTKNMFCDMDSCGLCNCKDEMLTPRKLLQLLGTECGRQIIHPNIWVNALFSEFKGNFNSDKYWLSESHKDNVIDYPNWIITDMRFPNELKAVKDRGGITIRVERWINKEFTKEEVYNSWEPGLYFGIDENGVESLLEDKKDIYNFERFATELNHSNHLSETSLDNSKFDYVIDNNGTLEELELRIKEILIKEGIIN